MCHHFYTDVLIFLASDDPVWCREHIRYPGVKIIHNSEHSFRYVRILLLLSYMHRPDLMMMQELFTSLCRKAGPKYRLPCLISRAWPCATTSCTTMAPLASGSASSPGGTSSCPGDTGSVSSSRLKSNLYSKKGLFVSFLESVRRLLVSFGGDPHTLGLDWERRKVPILGRLARTLIIIMTKSKCHMWNEKL